MVGKNETKTYLCASKKKIKKKRAKFSFLIRSVIFAGAFKKPAFGQKSSLQVWGFI